MIDIDRLAMEELRPRITVIGVGGAGGNAVSSLMASNAPGIDFILANTDAQALNGSHSGQLIQLGRQMTEGLGAGSLAAIGRAAAEESIDEICRAIEGAHMCFIAAGMGGGTGTGAAPVIAKAVHDKGILTVAVVTTPFAFEGGRRARAAEAGLDELQKHVDTLIVIPNQNLFRVANPNTTFKEAFKMADEVLQQGVRGITDLMVMPGLVNLDFADVRSVMRGMGKAMMGSGEATGENRALDAAKLAVANPLLDGAVKGARGMIISITGGEDMRLMEIDEAANYIKDMIDPEADIIWGSAVNPEFEGRMRVSIVATGLDPEVAMTSKAVQLPIPTIYIPHPLVSAFPPPPEPLELPPLLYADLFEPLAASLPEELALPKPAASPPKSVEPLIKADLTQGDTPKFDYEPAGSVSLFERMAQAVYAAARVDRRHIRSLPITPAEESGVYKRRGTPPDMNGEVRSRIKVAGLQNGYGLEAPWCRPPALERV